MRNVLTRRAIKKWIETDIIKQLSRPVELRPGDGVSIVFVLNIDKYCDKDQIKKITEIKLRHNKHIKNRDINFKVETSYPVTDIIQIRVTGIVGRVDKYNIIRRR